MACTTLTPRRATQGSCRPVPAKRTASPSRLSVSCSSAMVGVGLKATAKRISAPVEIPPCMPPEWLLRKAIVPHSVRSITSFT